MKIPFLIISIFFGSVFSFSLAQEPYPCGTDQKLEELINSMSPEEKIQYYKERQIYEEEIAQYVSQHNKTSVSEKSGEKTISYTIPIVFHIIHQGGVENISNEQVFNGLEQLNLDFQKLNSDWQNVVAQFLPIVGDMEIEFKLAKLDPHGNCTNGITRTVSSTTNTGVGSDQVNAVKAAHGEWPGDKYLNIFVAKNVGEGTAGYTFRPNNYFGNNMRSGIFITHNFLGTIGTGDQSGRGTLTHEVGHWLDLAHPWGNSNEPGLPENCEIDDGVADTPNTIGWTTCNLYGSTCDGTLDNVENFMEYSYCSKMFTNGQKLRVHAALNSSVGGRNKVWTPNNLAATGVSLPGTLCEVDFSSDKQVICGGSSIAFTDNSYNEITTRNWEFQGGTPATSTDINPTVTYDNPGIYQVKLTVSDGTNTYTKVENKFIRVLGAGLPLPFVEGFEVIDSLSNSFWQVENRGNDAGFEVTTEASQTGEKSAKLANFGQAEGGVDALISSPIDLSEVEEGDNLTLSFRYAYRKRKTSDVEKLNVYFTNNCGSIWSKRNVLSGSQLGTSFSSASWIPTKEEDWVTVHMTQTNLTSQFWISDFRMKFEFESDGGNNFFIDNINLYKGEPIEEPFNSVPENDFIHSFNIFPNPTSSVVNVAFSLAANKKVEINLLNTMGEKVQTNSVQGKKGENLVLLDTQQLSSGVYMLQMNTGGTQITKRIVKQ